jgi:cytochrome c oxidase subunit 2
MPTYQGQVSEDALIDLVEYLKQLNSNYRIQQTLTTADIPNPPAQQPAAAPQSGSAPHMVKQ